LLQCTPGLCRQDIGRQWNLKELRMSSVVIVDDQGVNRKVLTSLAATLETDVQVMAFGDPLQALSYIREHTPDLLITDYQMPTMNGAELIRRFRSVPDCRDVPAVVVTAYEDVAFRETALDAGATDFLLSPLNHSEFRQQSRRLLALRHAEMPLVRPTGEAVVDQFDMFNDLLENLSKRLVLKVHELRRSNAELQNLLEVGAIPAVFVDEDLRVRHFSPRISKIYALTDRDIGRPLDTVECTLDYDELVRDFQLVMRTGESVERYSIGRSETVLYLLRIIPNRPVDGTPLGALITFTDVSAWYDAESGRALH
jgi:CheY-like chemotaxis protein